MAFSARDRAEELPAGKDADPAGCRDFSGKLLVFVCRFDALAAEPRIDRSQQTLRHRRFSEGQNLCLVEPGLRALGFGIELADGLDLVGEEFDEGWTGGLGG